MYRFKEGARVCFYGDSITHGGIWIRRISDYYLNTAKIKCEMYNFGVSGNTAERAYARIDKLLAIKPTDVVVMFGMNDVARWFYDCRPLTDEILTTRRNESQKNLDIYKKILKEIKDAGANIIFCTPTPYEELCDTEIPTTIGMSGAIKEYGDRVLEMAKDYGNNVVDFNIELFKAQKQAFLKGNSLIRPDHVHPNEVGHEFMARFFLKEQGFDVELPYDYARLEELSKLPFSEWEEERFRLEHEAKRTEYPRYDVWWNVKDEKQLIELVKDTLENHRSASWAKGDTLKFVEGCYKDFLDLYDTEEERLQNYYTFVKTATK